MHAYIPSLLQLPPTISSIYVTSEHWAELPVLYRSFSWAFYFIHGGVYMSVPISQFIPASLLCPARPHICSLSLCFYSCPANRLISTIFYIPHINSVIYVLIYRGFNEVIWVKHLEQYPDLWRAKREGIYVSSVQLLSLVWLFETPWTATRQASLSITNSRSPPKTMSVESVMPSNHLILCCPLLFLPSISPSIRVFLNESDLRIRWPKYWSFSFNISPSSEHPGLISFRMDWLDLLADQGTLKSLLQHHSSKASIFQCSAFFIVQFSHPSMTTGKTIALTRQTFVGKVGKSVSKYGY